MSDLISNICIKLGILYIKEQQIKKVIIESSDANFEKLEEVNKLNQPIIDNFFINTDLNKHSKNVNFVKTSEYVKAVTEHLNSKSEEELNEFINSLNKFFDDLDSTETWYEINS